MVLTWNEYPTGSDDAGKRLDRVIRRMFPDSSLPEIYRALRIGRIRVDGRTAKPQDRLQEGSMIRVDKGFSASVKPRHTENPGAGAYVEAPACLVLATEHLAFFSKPAGMLAHGEGSLDEMTRPWILSRAESSLSFVPGPLHRIDRNTSGLMTFPLSSRGAREFSALLAGGGLHKAYLAILSNRLKEAAIWEDPLARDRHAGITGSALAICGESLGIAVTRVDPLLATAEASLALVRIATGRTHQIRAQASLHGFALLGDRKYGGPTLEGSYFLHAFRLGFALPPFPDLPKEIRAPLPGNFRTMADTLFGAEGLHEALGCADSIFAVDSRDNAVPEKDGSSTTRRPEWLIQEAACRASGCRT
jgi:23S rRNA pseudouridine955/2504/2580 synthase